MRRPFVLLLLLLSLAWQSFALASSAVGYGMEELDHAVEQSQPRAASAAMSADDADGAVEYLLMEAGGGQTTQGGPAWTGLPALAYAAPPDRARGPIPSQAPENPLRPPRV